MATRETYDLRARELRVTYVIGYEVWAKNPAKVWSLEREVWERLPVVLPTEEAAQAFAKSWRRVWGRATSIREATRERAFPADPAVVRETIREMLKPRWKA